MTNTRAINDIIYHMLRYQKKHKVIKCCVQNSLYLRDNINVNGWGEDVKAVPVLAVIPDVSKDTLKIFVHVVIECEGHLYDPSYEVASQQPMTYCRTFVELLRYVENASEDFLKTMLTEFLSFQNLADKINSGEFIVVDREHYINQANYVEKIFNPKNNKPFKYSITAGR